VVFPPACSICGFKKNKIVANGREQDRIFYLIKQVDELLFSDSVLELPRLSHPKKDRFNLLGSFWANKGYARYWTRMSTIRGKLGAYIYIFLVLLYLAQLPIDPFASALPVLVLHRLPCRFHIHHLDSAYFVTWRRLDLPL
jgi:hypothetical protein